MVNYDHAIGLIFMGLGGLYLLSIGETAAGTGLLGAIGGYVFKNGVVKRS